MYARRVISLSKPTLGHSTDAPRLLMVEQGGRGGVADYTAGLTRAFGTIGWHVVLATADDHCFEPAAGVRVVPVFHYVRGHSAVARWARRARLGPVANALRFLASMPRLMKLARRSDIVHCQGWEYAPLGVVAVGCLRLTGVPVVQTTHNTFERRRATLRFAHRALAALTACTIVHTEADLGRVPHEANGRVAVIPHGEYGPLARSGGSIDREQARAELGIGADTPVTLLFGQLRPDKGLGDLLAAAMRVPRLHVLIGGEENGALAAATDQLSSPELAGRVMIREGFLSMTEAAQLFAATDTVVLPYRVASQSGVLLLAYGFRRPVIIYPLGGLAEAVVDGETGWICSRADVDALVAALSASVAAGSAECLRRGEAADRLAQERYGWDATARCTADVYRAVLQARNRSDAAGD